MNIKHYENFNDSLLSKIYAVCFASSYKVVLRCCVAVPRSRKFFLKFLGSIEVSYHRGNDVLCQAINKVDSVTYFFTCFVF